MPHKFPGQVEHLPAGGSPVLDIRVLPPLPTLEEGSQVLTYPSPVPGELWAEVWLRGRGQGCTQALSD